MTAQPRLMATNLLPLRAIYAIDSTSTQPAELYYIQFIATVAELLSPVSRRLATEGTGDDFFSFRICRLRMMPCSKRLQFALCNLHQRDSKFIPDLYPNVRHTFPKRP
ncbi:hypothetical protein M405DRAFT_815068, partial [Rhizopogon salebrosus TDB-379]